MNETKLEIRFYIFLKNIKKYLKINVVYIKLNVDSIRWTDGRMEGKRGRGKPRVIMLDDIKDDETNEKIKRRAMDREC